MSTVRWKDILPWIVAPGVNPKVSTLSGEPVPAQSSGDAGLEIVFSCIEEELDLVPLRKVFPCVDPQISMASLALRPRSANLLRRHRLGETSRILDLDLRTLGDMRNAGPQFRRDLLEGLVFASVFATMFGDVESRKDSALGGAVDQLIGPAGDAHLRDRAGEIINDLRALADWNILIGQPVRPLLGSRQRYPERETQVVQRLLGLTAESLSLQSAPTLAELLHDRLSGISDARRVDILRYRVLSENPETLDELGRRHGVTRERIRQIENKLMKELEEMAAEDPFPSVLRMIGDAIGRLSSFEKINNEVPNLDTIVGDWDIPVWKFLSLLSKDFEIGRTWCAAPTITAAREATKSELTERADSHGSVRLADLDLRVDGIEEDAGSLTREWVELLGYRVFEDHALLNTSSMQDYAAGILSVCNEPLSSEEIVQHFDQVRSVRSLRNQLGEDQRFQRADRDVWALAEWEMEEYLPIKKRLLHEVEAAGGAVSLQDVTDRMTSQFSISPASIAAYANVPPLGLRGGMVVFSEESPEVLATVEDSAKFYRRGKAWLYRVSVTNEHMRGSGTVAPMAIVSLLNLQHGDPRNLPSVLGDQVVYWTGAQPTFGTLRRFVENLSAREGDQLFLLFRDDGSFDVERVPTLIDDPVADALALVGAPAALPPGVAQRALGMAIGASYSADLPELAQRYSDRGDQDVAELLWSTIWA